MMSRSVTFSGPFSVDFDSVYLGKGPGICIFIKTASKCNHQESSRNASIMIHACALGSEGLGLWI